MELLWWTFYLHCVIKGTFTLFTLNDNFGWAIQSEIIVDFIVYTYLQKWTTSFILKMVSNKVICVGVKMVMQIHAVAWMQTFYRDLRKEGGWWVQQWIVWQAATGISVTAGDEDVMKNYLQMFET